MLAIDHLVIATTDLSAGTASLEAQLGVSLAPGGEHTAMGTHNRLLSLGSDAYLELIAINPAAPAPKVPHWYNLDHFAGPPRLTHWAARCDNLDAALAAAPDGAGQPWQLERGNLRWRMAVPETGQTPFDGLFPALLQWQTPHPAPDLPDHGFRLTRLILRSPEAEALRVALGDVTPSGQVLIERADEGQIAAELAGPNGTIHL